MPLNCPQASILLRPAVGRERVEHITVDPAVELIGVKRMEPLLEAVVFRLQAANGFPISMPLLRCYPEACCFRMQDLEVIRQI